ncbi:unnamed protein product [Danaus chrysippus]|uniref:(African queen) hypothetical protein n=1 Tax=Danaus chrysippus TaxID=151541 RepID=A0A8J2R287_9NEOP|nr:unnamed protein product [Danaus chrysippus]
MDKTKSITSSKSIDRSVSNNEVIKTSGLSKVVANIKPSPKHVAVPVTSPVPTRSGGTPPPPPPRNIKRASTNYGNRSRRDLMLIMMRERSYCSGNLEEEG